MLKYELSDDEKKNNGVHLKFKIGIFNYQNKKISEFQDFNFYICKKGYQFCDIETTMKCLKEGEGYYEYQSKNYSCYETCKKCDKHNKPSDADYLNNYCDECKNDYPYYIDMGDYKSCYKECPSHTPVLKYKDKFECVSYCPKYKTIEGKCVDYCDYKVYKYLLENISMCYNYIPKNYFVYIDNNTDIYYKTDKPIIKLSEKCPGDFYDSSLNKFCINLEEDIFNFITNPNELIVYNEPLIKKLKTKEYVIRTYKSNKKIDDINNNKDKFISIDISLCEKKLKGYYNISNDEPLIFFDLFNIETEKYFYRVFTNEGNELNYSICNDTLDIIIKEIYYNIDHLNSSKCPKDFPYLNINLNKCSKNCDILSFLNKSCVTDYLTEENQINNINRIKNAIEEHSIDYLLDNITNGGDDIIIEEANIKYQLSSSWNQNYKNNENLSNIRIGNCENILKEKYNISLDEPLIIFKLDINMEGYKSPAIEYEIFNPRTKEKLNLKYCKDEQINISIPVKINENELFLYNSKGEFYNDICSTYTTKYNTDISLKDRQNEFLNKNMTLCESNCNYASYNYALKKVECKCEVKYNIKDLYEIKIDKDKLKANLNFKNLINIQVLKCYKKLFTKNGLIHNIGSYIILSIIFLFIVNLIILIIKEYSILKNEIKDIFNFISKSKTTELVNIVEKSKVKMLENNCSNTLPIFNDYLDNHKKINKNIQIIAKYIKYKKNKNNHTLVTNNIYNFKKKQMKLSEKMFLTEFEYNDFSYKKAIIYDKRTFWQYFFSLLKSEHLLLFAIIPSKDYNSKAIKICIFLFTFALFFADNAIFMNEDSFHNIYENQGNFDIIYQIPQIIYSNIISFVIDIIIRYLSLSQNSVINEKIHRIREIKNKNDNKFFRALVIKYIFFFVITFLFLIFFWLYISCFCFVYRNTQIYLIKNTMLSFGLSLITPLLFYFLSSAFRIYALKDKKKNRKLIYIISKLFLL